MSIELMCRKIGMTKLWNEDGSSCPVTVLEAQPNVVLQKRELGTDGYSAVQLGVGERREKLFTNAERGHFAKAGVSPKRHVKESRVSAEEVESFEVGQEIDCSIFEEGQKVDVIGTSKGRGFSGVVKRHGFAIKKMTHGTHEFFRHGGAIGAGAHPGRVIKGMKMAGQLGNDRVTTKNLTVVRVDPEQKLIFVSGGVPGHNDGIVQVRSAKNSR